MDLDRKSKQTVVTCPFESVSHCSSLIWITVQHIPFFFQPVQPTKYRTKFYTCQLLIHMTLANVRWPGWSRSETLARRTN